MKEHPLILPELTELEAFRRSVNRKLWVMIGGLLAVTFTALGLALIAFARPIPVVAFDGEGRAILFEDTVSPRTKMDNVRVEYFVEYFLNRFAGVDSARVSEDFGESVNMMTPRFRRIILHDEKEIARRRKYADANLRGRFENLQFNIAAYPAEDTAARIHLVAWGRMRFTPRLGAVDETQELIQHVYSQVVLERVPVTKQSIHGLLVDYVHTRFFDSEEDLKVHVLKEQDR